MRCALGAIQDERHIGSVYDEGTSSALFASCVLIGRNGTGQLGMPEIALTHEALGGVDADWRIPRLIDRSFSVPGLSVKAVGVIFSCKLEGRIEAQPQRSSRRPGLQSASGSTRVSRRRARRWKSEPGSMKRTSVLRVCGLISSVNGT